MADLAVSRTFYSDVLGFVPDEGHGYSDGRLVLISPLLAHGYRCIVLTRDRRAVDTDGVLLELETNAELLDRYMLARLLGARTTPLISRGRTLAVSVHDPDGHRIALRARRSEPRDAGDGVERPAVRWGRDVASTTMTGRFRREHPRVASPRAEDTDPFSWFDALCTEPPPGPGS